MEERFKNIFDWSNFVSLLNEGLIHTYPIKTTVKLLTNKLSSLNIKGLVQIEEITDTIFLKCESHFYSKEKIKDILRLITTCGFFPSTFKFYDENDVFTSSLIYTNSRDLEKIHIENLKSSFTQITFESKFNKNTEVNNNLYHVTLTKNIYKILKKRLIPKNINKKSYHTQRIYLGFDKLSTKYLAFQFEEKSDYTLLEININNLDITLYDDPDYIGHGCYTYDNIPPNRIKIIDEFKN